MFPCCSRGAYEDDESLTTALSAETAVLVKPGDDMTVNLGGRDARSTSFRKIGPGSFKRALGWTESRVALEVALEDNQDAWSNDMLEEGERLVQRLETFGLTLDRQIGDGNCQFRAISSALYGTPNRHPQIRRRAVQYIASAEGRRRFEPYLGKQGISEYLDQMAREGTWGDELVRFETLCILSGHSLTSTSCHQTLRAVAERYQVVVSVITSSRTNFYIKYCPDTCRKKGRGGEVFLAYTCPCHYDRIVRR